MMVFENYEVSSNLTFKLAWEGLDFNFLFYYLSLRIYSRNLKNHQINHSVIDIFLYFQWETISLFCIILRSLY